MLSTQFSEYVRAGFAGLWIQSFEHDEAVRDLGAACKDRRWTMAVWDIDVGLSGAELAGANDPLSALKAAASLRTDPNGTAVLILKNFHKFISSAEIIQSIDRQITQGKADGIVIVILSPVVQIPIELQKLFVVLEHELPSRAELQKIAESLAQDGELPTGADLERLLDAAGGLTRYEAENAFSLSLVRKGRIDSEAVWDLKTQTLQKSGLLSLHHGSERFQDIGGMESLKRFCLRALAPNRDKAAVRARGVLLLGVAGTGKSALAKALGNETGRPTLTLDIGALMGSLVGQTEQNVRQALRIVDAMAPCVLFCDEIEKALAGSSGTGSGDSGVSTRLFGTLLTWMNDHTSDVFFIATSNDVSKLPPEFTRAERFDGVFFLDLPTSNEKAAIWTMYTAHFGLEQQDRPNDNNWTGAEIKACCRLAALLNVSLSEASQNIVPVATTASESVDRLRSWASGRCLDAQAPGIYRKADKAAPVQGRRIARDILAN